MLRHACAALIAVAFSGAVEFSARADDTVVDPLVDRFSLANGLCVVLAPDARSAVVSMRLQYRVGARDSPPTRPGMTALVSHLLKRTAHVADGDYDRLLNEAGGYDAQSSVVHDRTIFKVTLPSARMALPLWLWSEQMGYFGANLDDHLIEQEAKVLRNQRVQVVDNAPGGRSYQFVNAALYPPEHPYRIDAWPSDKMMEGLTAGEIRAFVEPRYGPNNAILVLAGDFDVRRARELIRTYFEALPSRAVPPRPGGERAALNTEARLRIAARVELPSVSIIWSTPSLGAPGDAELDIIGELLAGDRAGWLRWALVDRLKIASSVSATQTSRALDSNFIIKAFASPGHTSGELVQAIDQVLTELQAKGPGLHDLRAAVVGYLIHRVFGLERSSQRAERYADCEERLIGGYCLKSFMERYGRIDGPALSATAARELPLQRRVVVEFVPSADVPIAGELLRPVSEAR